MPVTPPTLTAEQRQAALAKAQEARRVRAELKELLKTGSVTLPQLFQRADQDRIVAGMKIGSVLSALPKVGKVKAKRALETAGIDGNRRIRGLGARQKEALLERFS